MATTAVPSPRRTTHRSAQLILALLLHTALEAVGGSQLKEMPPKRKAADPDLEARVRPIAEQYIKWDPNPETRSAVQKLLDADDFAALDKSLSSRLEFGTAGLRGPTKAESNRTAGVCATRHW